MRMVWIWDDLHMIRPGLDWIRRWKGMCIWSFGRGREYCLFMRHWMDRWMSTLGEAVRIVHY